MQILSLERERKTFSYRQKSNTFIYTFKSLTGSVTLWTSQLEHKAYEFCSILSIALCCCDIALNLRFLVVLALLFLILAAT